MTSRNGLNDSFSTTIASPIGPPATYDEEVAITVMIAVLGTWSTLGNVLTIMAITTKRCMKTKTNVFIFSLAISDLVSGAVASPLWLYRRSWGFNPWEWGQFACKLYWFTDETTSYCTAMHIAAFAIWRFILVKWPHKMGTIKIRTIVIWVSAIWIVSIIFGGFAYSSFFTSIEKPQDGSVYSSWPMCSVDFTNNGVKKYKTYYTFSSTTFMLIPMALLVVMSLLITKELYFNKIFKTELRKIKEKKAVAQLAMIAASFMIAYLPMTTYILWTIRNKKDHALDYWLGVGAYFCLRLCECVNPIVYNVSSEKMRGASKEVLMNIWACCGKKTSRRDVHARISRSSRGGSSIYDKKSNVVITSVM